VLGQLHQVNLPGTADEYPNWRHKLPLDLEDLPTDPRMQALVGVLRSERGASVSPTK
jgi:4-alpha-glucanotransferase